MSYSAEEIIEPFWAEQQAEASGRDPLAIQNSSVVIYARMIAGITNVTNRLRYNGFYCWLIDTIIKKFEPKNSLVEQVRFIRRGELLLAYMMVNNFPDITGVSGSAYAGNHPGELINLKTGADWDTKTKDSPSLYWKFKSGAFGQYFSGVLSDLNLINHPQLPLNIYTLTAKGRELAEAFRSSLPVKEITLFWKFVLNGTLRESDLSNISSFSLVNISVDSAENEFYKKILLAEDDRSILPTFHRRDSIKLLLEFLNTEKGVIENLPVSFLKFNFNQQKGIATLPYNTATGWYLYEINELLHVAFEHFHACFLNILENYPTPVDEVIESLVKEFASVCKREKVIASKTTISELLATMKKQNREVYEYYDDMQTLFYEEEWGACLLNAVKVFLQVYRDCEKQIEQLKEYAWLAENNFNRPGYAIELIDELILSKREFVLTDYLKKILLLAVNQHTFSSYRKSKIGQGLVHNYLIEDNLVWRLRSTLPNRTSPRLQNVTQYLNDIGWIKRQGKKVSISGLGKNILKSL